MCYYDNGWLCILLFLCIDSGFFCGLYVFVVFVERKDIVGDIVIFDCIVNGFFKLKVIWLFDGLFVVFGSGYFVVG